MRMTARPEPGMGVVLCRFEPGKRLSYSLLPNATYSNDVSIFLATCELN